MSGSDAAWASIRSWEDAARQDNYRQTINPAARFGTEAYYQSGKRQAEALLDATQRFMPDTTGVVLDFGCGDGRVIEWWPDTWERWAADSSVSMLDRLTQRHAPSLIHPLLWDGLSKWGGIDDGFDVVFAVAVLIHHRIADGQAIAVNLGRLLRPDGLLLLAHPLYHESREGVNWTDVTVWSPADLTPLLVSGLSLVECWVSPGVFSFAEVGPHHGATLVLRKEEG